MLMKIFTNSFLISHVKNSLMNKFSFIFEQNDIAGNHTTNYKQD